MTLSQPPTQISKYELDRVRVIAGDSSPVYTRLLDQHRQYEQWEAERDRQEAKLRAAREKREEAATQAREIERGAERDAHRAALRNHQRQTFLAANPTATEEDYRRLEQRIADDQMVRQAEQAWDAEIDALRRSGKYTM